MPLPTLAAVQDVGRIETILTNINCLLDTSNTNVNELEKTLQIVLLEDRSEDACVGAAVSAVSTSPLQRKLSELYDRIDYLNIKLAKLHARIEV